MDKWFGTEGYLQSAFCWIRNLAILNGCFLLSCLPVFTIGAAITALSDMNLRMLRGEEGNVFPNYWKAFRKNFVQSTRLWIGVLGLICLFGLDFWALGQLTGLLSLVLKVLLGALLVVFLAAVHYLFAYTARFSDSLRVIVANSLMLCGSHLLHTAALMSLTFLSVFVSLYSLGFFLRAVFVWLVIGFSSLNCLHCFLLRPVFAQYE